MSKRKNRIKEKVSILFLLIRSIPYASIISLVAQVVFIICAGTLLNYELESYRHKAMGNDLSKLIMQMDIDSSEEGMDLAIGEVNSKTDTQDLLESQLSSEGSTWNSDTSGISSEERRWNSDASGISSEENGWNSDASEASSEESRLNSSASDLDGKTYNPNLSKEQMKEYWVREKQIQMALTVLNSIIQTYLKPYESETIRTVSGGAFEIIHEDEDETYKMQEEKLYEQIQKLEEERKTIEEALYVPNTIVHNLEEQEDLDQERVIQDFALKKYQMLIDLNQDFYGWLTIEGTNMNLPVVTTANNEYYLTHDFYQKESKYGTLFLDFQSDVTRPSRNLMIYGHNMSDGSMLHDLLEYKDEAFYEEHKTFCFDTIYGKETYEVVAAFYSQVYNREDEVFKYYQYTNPTKTEMTEFLNQIKKLSRYDTKVDSSNDDFFVTLSTCAYHKKNGRFVVVGRKITNPGE